MLWPQDNKINQYDDVDPKLLKLNNEQWKYDENSLSVNNINDFSTLSSSEHEAIKTIRDGFATKAYLSHYAQGHEKYPLINTYKTEEVHF